MGEVTQVLNDLYHELGGSSGDFWIQGVNWAISFTDRDRKHGRVEPEEVQQGKRELHCMYGAVAHITGTKTTASPPEGVPEDEMEELDAEQLFRILPDPARQAADVMVEACYRLFGDFYRWHQPRKMAKLLYSHLTMPEGVKPTDYVYALTMKPIDREAPETHRHLQTWQDDFHNTSWCQVRAVIVKAREMAEGRGL